MSRSLSGSKMLKLLPFVTLALFAVRQVSAAENAELVGPYAQCGGEGYTGNTDCYPGYVCVKLNAWFSQCQPTTAPQPTISIPTPSFPTTTPPTSTPPTTTQIPTTTTTTTVSTPSTTVVVPTTTVSTPTVPKPSASAGGLQEKLSNHSGKLYFGSCADPNTLNIANNVNVLKSDFGCVTPENSMKWDATEPNRGSFSYGNADTLVNWATSNGKLIRGHTLVWHSQLPGWVSNINDQTTLRSVIENHISNLAGRYAGKLYAWDVCNEIFEENGSLRSSVFQRVLGESFVTIAFQAARKADSKAVLYINDYNLDSVNAKVNGMISLVNRVNAATPNTIDGIGTQMHLQGGQGSTAQAVLTALAGATVKEVAITELDIAGAPAQDYNQVVQACVNTPKCVGITVWGVSDTNSWRSNTSPLLFDGSYRPKAAYNTIIGAL